MRWGNFRLTRAIWRHHTDGQFTNPDQSAMLQNSSLQGSWEPSVSGPLLSFLPGQAGRADRLIAYLQFVQFDIAQVLNINHLVACLIQRMDQLVQLQVDRPGIPVLRVLDQEEI